MAPEQGPHNPSDHLSEEQDGWGYRLDLAILADHEGIPRLSCRVWLGAGNDSQMITPRFLLTDAEVASIHRDLTWNYRREVAEALDRHKQNRASGEHGDRAAVFGAGRPGFPLPKVLRSRPGLVTREDRGEGNGG